MHSIITSSSFVSFTVLSEKIFSNMKDKRRLRILVIVPNDYERLITNSVQLREKYEFILTDVKVNDCENESYDVLTVLKHLITEYSNQEIDGVLGTGVYLGVYMSSFMSEYLQLPGPKFRTTLLLGNKYHSRQLQSIHLKSEKSIPDFAIIQCSNISVPENFHYPFFVKPVKGCLSSFATMVYNDDELKRACDSSVFTDLYMSMTKPVQQLMSYCKFEETSLLAFIAEKPLYGEQVTVEGFVTSTGRVVIMGIVDSIMYPGTISFQRFEYPSSLSDKVQQRMRDISIDMMSKMDFKSSCFNIEFMYNRQKDLCSIIEINPRLSYQFCEFYEYVDGINSFEIQLKLITDTYNDDCWKPNSGPENVAISFVLRRFKDAFVERVPDEDDISNLKVRYPQIKAVVVTCGAGKRLSEVLQDAGSYRYATVTVIGQTRKEVFNIFEEVQHLLPFEFKELQLVSILSDVDQPTVY